MEDVPTDFRERLDVFFAQVRRLPYSDQKAVLNLQSDLTRRAQSVLKYVEDLELRSDFFWAWQSVGQYKLNAATLAVFMVAPLERLRHFDTIFKGYEREGMNDAPSIRNKLAKRPLRAMKFYTGKASFQAIALFSPPSSQDTTTLSSQEPDEPASRVSSLGADVLARQRDDGVCIFSGTVDPGAAYIFPHAAMERDNRAFASMLKLFWGEEKARRWIDLIQSDAETPRNRLFLNSHLQHLWIKAAFALKPLSQSPNEVVVQWHWLKRSKLLPNHRIQYRNAFESAGLFESHWGEGIAYRASGLPIETGQVFVIRSNTPDELPSFDLLELQWNMVRVAAICGAADNEEWSRSWADDED
ncbi:hypothetical protein B0J13DRAFT_634611 [Dactylonectria estremocensis]|uniref:HNH nuclease domain-containing protein n=1 Tax=Dactylonectria estremocensis TaxID=1079267 RepID=A0A9P9JF70_9HYPO|nr:hypothetical protein B0J13DRAFT_634611 [Dactylonectria estremocensis]